MPIEVGTHRNGKRFAKATLTGDGFYIMVEGVGENDDIATARLAAKLTEIGEMCEDVADEMVVGGAK